MSADPDSESAAPLASLETEGVHPDTVNLDLLDANDLVAALLHVQQRGAIDAVDAARQQIALAVEASVDRLRGAGRLIYVGAGTSGLLAAADAAELPPTFGIDPARLTVLRPTAALATTEDGRGDGDAATAELVLGSDDVVVGLAASGRTPFVLGVAQTARRRGALTIGVANNPSSPLAQTCELAVDLLTGPEPIAGSTRMNAGLAQKLFLSTFSTAVMVSLGFNYSNHMTRTTSSLTKLNERRLRTVGALAEVDQAAARLLLTRAEGDVEVAVTMARLGLTRAAAQRRLADHGSLRRALEQP